MYPTGRPGKQRGSFKNDKENKNLQNLRREWSL
jgi:hypothetical protein